MAAGTTFDVGGRKLTLSNIDKVLYPACGFTKGQVIDYYIQIAPVLLPHLKNRALTLKRYPGGVDEEFFYEKRCPKFKPAWFKTAEIWSEGNQADISFCLANDLPSLVWLANLATLELHTSLALAKKPDQPAMLVFDLDPGPGTNVIDCAEVGILLRKYLRERGLECFPKTSGSKGLQIYAPINTRVTYDQTKAFAHEAANFMAKKYPDKITSVMAKVERQDKIFIDWSQNDRHKTTVCVYSLRAKDQPTVSTPVKWSEVEAAIKSRDAADLTFQTNEVIKRSKKFGDLFEPLLSLKQKFPKS